MHTPASLKLAVAVFAVAAIGAGTAAAGQEAKSKSAPLAKQLTQALDTAKLDSIAAPDPNDPSTFIAALYIQGSQMLVVSAKYSAPTLLVDKINKKEFREVYIDLNSASIAGTKVFIMDQLADGFMAKPGDDQAPDTWEQGKTQLAFDGDYKKAKISEADYQKSFDDADAKYARMLSLLLAQVKGRAGTRE